MTDSFDQERFAALLDLAGQETAVELTQRLDEDLTSVGLALTGAVDPVMLHAQSHILVAISGTIGATRVYDLAKHLNAMSKMTDPVGLAAVLAEIRIALNDLILRVRASRYDQTKVL